MHNFENHSDQVGEFAIIFVDLRSVISLSYFRLCQVWSVSYDKDGTKLVSGGDDALLQVYHIN